MSNNKQIEKQLELPHQETIVGINTIQTKPFDNQKIEIMSNNKQSMKLYTEEQILEFLKVRTVPCTHRIIFDSEDLEELTPIELPSDEEIKKTMTDFDEFDTYDVTFLGGAIWMRNKIQGGNNDQQ